MEKACYLQWQMNDIGNKVRNKSQSKGTFLTVISTAQPKSKEAVGMQNGIILKRNDFVQKRHFHVLRKLLGNVPIAVQRKFTVIIDKSRDLSYTPRVL